MDITEFVKARLDKDEWIAQGAARTDDGRDGHWLPVHFRAGGFDARIDDHIARHDPARVLREVAAKRTILAEHAPSYPAVARQEPPGPATVADPDGISSTFPYCATCDQDSPCATLAHLAAVWSDHPDYRAEWKP